MKRHRRRTHKKEWAYQNTIFLVASLIVLALLADTPIVHGVIHLAGSYGYVGSFMSGIFFTSTFTIAPAGIVLYHLAQDYNPLLIAVTAGAGAVLGDLILFNILRDAVFEEFRPLVNKLKRRPVFAIFKTPYFAWFTPVLGAFIIASPFPDEIGIGLLGATKVKRWQFMLLTFVLNTLGVLSVVLLARMYG